MWLSLLVLIVLLLLSVVVVVVVMSLSVAIEETLSAGGYPGRVELMCPALTFILLCYYDVCGIRNPDGCIVFGHTKKKRQEYNNDFDPKSRSI